MILYLLRHAEAQTDENIADDDRALTIEGTRTMQTVGLAFRRMDIHFDAVYTSPLLRARQSAEIALGNMENAPVPMVTEHLRNGASFDDLFRLLNGRSEKSHVLLVGHDPHLSRLISALITGTLQARFAQGMCGVC